MAPSDLAELLQTALHEHDFRRSQAAARALSACPAADLAPCVPEIAAALCHPDPLVQRRAAQALAVLGPAAASAVPALIEALSARRWTMREAAAQALGRVGGSSAALRAALVTSALHDRTALVREASTLALGQLGEALAARGDLLAGLRHPFARVRCRALRALALPGHFCPDLLSVFTTALADGDFKVRRTAAEQLGPLGALALPALPALLRRQHDREARVGAVASAALAQLGKELPPPLQPWLRYFSEPGQPASVGLQRALVEGDLPGPLQSDFLALCARRTRWHQRLAPVDGASAAIPAAPWEAAQGVLDAAARAAEAHAPPKRERAHVGAAAREQEAAWLTAWLWNELERCSALARAP
jgi:HEAT repeat protein